jgi:hypothetical protein
MKPYANHRRHFLACAYGCCRLDKARLKVRALKKGARQAARRSACAELASSARHRVPIGCPEWRRI